MKAHLATAVYVAVATICILASVTAAIAPANAACYTGCGECLPSVPYSVDSAGITRYADGCTEHYPGLALSQADLMMLRHALARYRLGYLQFRQAMTQHFELFSGATPYSAKVNLEQLGPFYAEEFQKLSDIVSLESPDAAGAFLMAEAQSRASADNLRQAAADELVGYAMERLGVSPALMPVQTFMDNLAFLATATLAGMNGMMDQFYNGAAELYLYQAWEDAWGDEIYTAGPDPAVPADQTGFAVHELDEALDIIDTRFDAAATAQDNRSAFDALSASMAAQQAHIDTLAVKVAATITRMGYGWIHQWIMSALSTGGMDPLAEVGDVNGDGTSDMLYAAIAMGWINELDGLSGLLDLHRRTLTRYTVPDIDLLVFYGAEAGHRSPGVDHYPRSDIGQLPAYAIADLPAVADLTVGPGETYTTIQAAIDAAQAGDSIEVRPGTDGAPYRETVTVDTPGLTIFTRDAGDPAVIGAPEGADYLTTGITVTADNVKIYNFRILRTVTGVRISDADACIIANNHIQWAAYGIDITETNDTVIAGNRVHDTLSRAVRMVRGAGNRVFYNAFSLKTGITGTATAYDGGDVQWDDGTACGNWWGDWSGTGAYTITAGSDRDDRVYGSRFVAAGTVLTAKAHITGVFGYASREMDFYYGDPDNGGILINAAPVTVSVTGLQGIGTLVWDTKGYLGPQDITAVLHAEDGGTAKARIDVRPAGAYTRSGTVYAADLAHIVDGDAVSLENADVHWVPSDHTRPAIDISAGGSLHLTGVSFSAVDALSVAVARGAEFSAAGSVFNAKVTLHHGTTPLMTGFAATSADLGIAVTADTVRISHGGVFALAGADYTGYALTVDAADGLRVADATCTSLTVSNTDLSQTTAGRIANVDLSLLAIENSRHINVEDIAFSGGLTPLSITISQYVSLTGLSFSQTGDTALAAAGDVSYLTIRDSRFEDCAGGIRLDLAEGTSNVDITANRFTQVGSNDQAAIVIDAEALAADGGITVTKNDLNGATDAVGLRITGGHGTYLFDNTFQHLATGLVLSGASGIVATGNRFIDCGAEDDSGNTWSNAGVGNYWYDHTCTTPDPSLPGVCLDGYTNAAGVTDLHPLIGSGGAVGRIDLAQTAYTDSVTDDYACSDTSGETVACAGSGQDGDHQAGVAWPSDRFENHGDGTVTDDLTGLMWLATGNAVQALDAGFDVDGAADGRVYWHTAMDFAAHINGDAVSGAAGYSDWRVPSINELLSLTEADAFTTGQFIGSWAGFTDLPADPTYWSSTVDNDPAQPYAWAAGFGDSRTTALKLRNDVGADYPETCEVLLVRAGTPEHRNPVVPAPASRSGQGSAHAIRSDADGALAWGVAWPAPRFVDNGDGTVTDALTGLVWLQNAGPATTVDHQVGLLTWQQALDFVAALNDGTYPGNDTLPGLNAGYTDWRMPNFKEMLSLTDYSRFTPNALPDGHPFTGIQPAYWTSTTDRLTPDIAYFWDAANKGRLDRSEKTSALAVWPVRGGRVSYGSSPRLVIDDSRRDFGTVAVGAGQDTDHVIDVIIGNGGDADLTLGPVYFVGPDRESFYFLNNTPPSGVVVLPGQQVDCRVGFSPPDSGAKEAYLIITGDDPHHPSVAVPLSGQGLAYTLTVGLVGNGSGQIQISPEGGTPVTTATGTTLTLNPGTPVHLYPRVDTGSLDGGWQGDATGLGDTVITMDGPRSLDYRFTLRQFEIAAAWQDTTAAVAGGTISPSGTVIADYGAAQTFTITPDPFYTVADIILDGRSMGPSAAYTIENITGDHTVTAVFELAHFVVTATAGDHGTITPYGPTTVAAAHGIAFTITPDPGYHIVGITDNGVDAGSAASYTIGSVEENHDINVTFALDTHTITPIPGEHITISPAGAQRVAHGGNATMTITPDSGYGIVSVLVDGANVGPAATYTFENVTSDHTITAIAAPLHTITATAGENGALDPDGQVAITAGSDLTLTVHPDEGYDIADVIVDGASVGALAQYTFTDIDADHTFEALFAIRTYTVTTASGAGGQVFPEGAATVAHDAALVVAITPDAGFEVAEVAVDGTAIGAVSGTYRLMGVTTDHAISVQFREITFPVALPATGQTTSYAAGDDGDAPRGAPWPDPRFTDNGDGTITDHLSGLVWIDRTDLCGVMQMTWQAALDCVSALNASPESFAGQGYTAAYSDWRLPNANEMASLVVNGRAPAVVEWLNAAGFSLHTTTYWTSTPHPPSDGASAYRFALGSSAARAASPKTDTHFLLPVRGRGTGPGKVLATGQVLPYAAGDDGDLRRGVTMASSRFKDNGDGTFTDNLTGRQWLKNADPIETGYPGYDTFGNMLNEGRVSWPMALAFIGGINNGTYPVAEAAYGDWHLPTASELASLMNVTQAFGDGDRIPGAPVDHLRSMYWSGTSRPSDPSNTAWVGNFWDMRIDAMSKTADMNGARPWPVRQAGKADLTLTVGAMPDAAAAGETVTVSAIVTNNGPDVADTVRFTVTTGGGAAYDAATADQGSVVHDSGSTVFRIGTLAPGASVTAAVTLTALDDRGPMSISMAANAPAVDPAPDDNTSDANIDITQRFHITVSRSGSGTVTSTDAAIDCGTSCAATYGGGETITLQATPDTGFVFAGFTGGGCEGQNPCTLVLGQDVTVAAAFTPQQHAITAGAGVGGSVSPSGTQTYDHGAAQQYVISPEWGYDIVDVLVDGASIGAVDTYRFDPIDADHTITAAFARVTHTIAAEVTSGSGWISPSGLVPVSHGDAQVFTFGPDTGWRLSYVLVNGMAVTATGSYTFENVTDSLQRIQVGFDGERYTISATAGAGGWISPSGSRQADHGAEMTFTLTAEANYHVSEVVVDGGSVGTPTAWTFSDIHADHTISATFALNPHRVSVQSVGSGKIVPDGDVYLEDDGSQAFYFIPNPGAALLDVTIDGASVLADIVPAGPDTGMPAGYVLTGVNGNRTLVAVFTTGPAGDVDGDGEVRLQDAIKVLRLVSGASDAEAVSPAGDANGDGVVGLADGLYILQLLVGQRAP